MVEHDEKKQADPGFKVVDRRHADDEGSAQPDHQPSQGPARATPHADTVESKPTADHHGDENRPPIDFLTFTVSLATNAVAALGLLPKEHSHGLPESPELAREYIDILAMLQEKTRGNLTEEETAALSQMLTDLRLQYVERARRG